MLLKQKPSNKKAAQNEKYGHAQAGRKVAKAKVVKNNEEDSHGAQPIERRKMRRRKSRL